MAPIDLSRRCFVAGSCAAGALLAVSGCGSGSETIAPDGTVTVTNGQAVLPFSRFAALATVGGGVTVATPSGTPFAVVRTGAQSAIAINALCTHEGCTASYVASTTSMFCACHGSRFTTGGAVTHGPATMPLSPSYAAVVGADAITVTIAG